MWFSCGIEQILSSPHITKCSAHVAGMLTSQEDPALHTEPEGRWLGELSHLGQGQHFELFRFSMNWNPKLHIMKGICFPPSPSI